ncbi:methyltransferase domain-containing protein [Novosphingobium beihaiensis]|uniref:Class I SAM-dependent methyltransferase n=1 Tax=Novosphingobium beihaiensis TaxID=2930389 RepID=A0ABT0BPJ3_9SPHN|nr:class I SAM-dependent methyltransferase [Novosphingobium beihaiensis]MCJ2186870.1 class I SAM-dependent methyltransferase [Novosphingobium beihaiensis]
MTEDRVADTVIDVYRRHGPAWARLRGDRCTEQRWFGRFCDLLPEGASVLDIGCGSGKPLARELVRRGFAVTGVDAAPEMLALFRRNLPDTPACLADMRELALGQRFAGLLAWDSFFHLRPDDQRKMFRRFQDHAAPGAALMFTSGPSEGCAIGDMEGEPLYHGSLGPEEYRSLLQACGFEVAGHAAEDPEAGKRTVWLARQTG